MLQYDRDDGEKKEKNLNQGYRRARKGGYGQIVVQIISNIKRRVTRIE